MGENLVCNFDEEDEQAMHTHGNAESEAQKVPLEGCFVQFKDLRDSKVETNEGDNEVEDDYDQFNEEERNNTDDWDARFYINNILYGVVDNKEPKSNSNHPSL